ncbi:hypothetical protein [Oceanibacterium hippocampi]|uniref:Uncharacterized protein n=1 Tax=Oceanibacterium hippocampi TaxID=745714 RepID=A0A1Y5TPA1_9PROT|nr:hypothetical protein [Oceanibacterium hippocampi]SLN66551.1 hypothetical protein OCH7691_03072 [Oceanibacterium hippocampi]
MKAEQIRTLVAKSCLSMDDEKFADYLALCADGFQYRIRSFSPEIGKEMTWLDLGLDELKGLLEAVPKHVRMQGQMRRHATLYTLDEDADGRFSAVSSLIVSHTALNGETHLFATGQFHDRVTFVEGEPRLLARDVMLDTRVLGPGSHMPI